MQGALALIATTTTATVSPDDPMTLVGPLVHAFGDKDWLMVAGLVLMAAIFVLKKTGVLEKIKLGSKWGIRLSTLILAVLGSVAAGLVAHQDWWTTVKTALGIATTAVGGWEFLGKLMRDTVGKSSKSGAVSVNDVVVVRRADGNEPGGG